MAYYVLALTMAQVRSGSLQFQRLLQTRQNEEIGMKVYSASPFDLEERRRLKDRFGGDVVYFFNETAHAATIAHDLDLNFSAEIPDNELPRRKTVVIGSPE